MTGITFVRGEIDRAIDVDRQISVHLNHAVEIAFVPVVTAPRLVVTYSTAKFSLGEAQRAPASGHDIP